MEPLKVTDKVVVQRKGCCHGFERGTVCQIIQVYTNPTTGKLLYLCYPDDTSVGEYGMWQCSRCITKVPEEK